MLQSLSPSGLVLLLFAFIAPTKPITPKINQHSNSAITEIQLYDVEKRQYWSPPLRKISGVNSPFGLRESGFHQGVDLALYWGEPVFAVFDGIIKTSTFSYGYGNHIVISHDNGLETLYAHLEARIKVGARVKAGQFIAIGGNTGWSTGAHLHFEIRYNGLALNPAWVFDFKEEQIKSDKLFLDYNSLVQYTNISYK